MVRPRLAKSNPCIWPGSGVRPRDGRSPPAPLGGLDCPGASSHEPFRSPWARKSGAAARRRYPLERCSLRPSDGGGTSGQTSNASLARPGRSNTGRLSRQALSASWRRFWVKRLCPTRTRRRRHQVRAVKRGPSPSHEGAARGFGPGVPSRVEDSSQEVSEAWLPL